MALTLALTAMACSTTYDKDGSDVNVGEDTDTDNGALDADDDGDGFSENDGDCNDNNADINPNAAEICNNKDDDCNGEVDDDPTDGSVFYEDYDGDGYGDGAVSVKACSKPAGYTTNADDCDDLEYDAKPGGFEINWDGVDQNCDGKDYDLSTCMEAAVAATSAEMEGVYSVPDYSESFFLVMDLTLQQQELSVRENSSTAIVSTQDADSYNVEFNTFIAYNSQDWPFWFDMEPGTLAAAAGIEDRVYCDGWVNEKPAGFAGTLEAFVNPTAKSVSAEVNLVPTTPPITESDVNLVSLDGGLCTTQVIDIALGFAQSIQGISLEAYSTCWATR